MGQLKYVCLLQYKSQLLSTGWNLWQTTVKPWKKRVCYLIISYFSGIIFQRRSHQCLSVSLDFTLFARGDGCNVKEKRASLQLDDKKVFSAVVEISNNEFILNKVT